MAHKIQQAGKLPSPKYYLKGCDAICMPTDTATRPKAMVLKNTFWLQRLLSSSRGPRLSEDAFEGVIDSFEKGLHHALEQRTELWPSVIEASTAAPDIESILPPEEACELSVRPIAVNLCLSKLPLGAGLCTGGIYVMHVR